MILVPPGGLPASALCLFLCLFAAWAPAGPGRFDPGPLMAQASAMLEQGRFLEGVDAFEMVYEHSDDPKAKALALTRMAAVYALFLDQKDQALAIYGRVMDDYPDQAPPEAAFDRAMLLYESGRLQQAQTGFTAFITAYPDSPRRFTAEYMAERIRDERAAGAPAPARPEPSGGWAEPMIRVVLSEKPSCAVETKAASRLMAPGRKDEILPPGRHVFTADRGVVRVDGLVLGKRAELVPGLDRFTLGKTAYAGRLVLSADGSGLTAVNVLPLEQYLKGVVPREMSPSWDEEALMAQAVAARSYAAALAAKSSDRPYDVAATTASQVYGGAEAGNARTDKAVDATRGRVLADGGRPLLAYFHAHSGGATEDDANVWTADLPYYRVQDDAVSLRAKPMSWTFTATADQVARALADHGFPVSRVTDLGPGQMSPSGRMKTVVAATDAGPVEVKANALRIWLGAGKMKSVLCTVVKDGNTFIFKGRGYGHGVGMSQWGAQGMAREGKSHLDILGHYYPGAEIVSYY